MYLEIKESCNKAVRKNYLSFLPKTIMQGIKRSQVSNKRDILKWTKKKRNYGKREIADETVFSSIKRTYGEYMYLCNQISKYDKRDDFKSVIVHLFRRMA